MTCGLFVAALLLSVWASVSSNRTWYAVCHVKHNLLYTFSSLVHGFGPMFILCVCVLSASRNVCAPPILRWLPKTKMAARTPEKEKERARDRERWRQHAKCREKRNRLALSPPFRLLFFCLCECICPNHYTLYQIMLAWASVFPYHLQPPDKHLHKHTCTRSLP